MLLSGVATNAVGFDLSPGYAFNIFSHNAPVLENGYNEEEMKMVKETRKIWNDKDVKVTATCIWVPVMRAHAESVNLQFEKPLDEDTAREILRGAPGVTIVDDRAANRFPTPLEVSDKDDVAVGRIRQDLSLDDNRGLDIFVCGDQIRKGKCDLFNGEWIPNPSGPAYTNASCRFIDDHQNCMMNGRPDKGYLHWKWKPYGCELPPFDAVRFLDSMRNKAWGLIGDSILRNQVQSLLSILSKAEEPVEVYHDKEFKNRRWHFQSYNFTVSIVWAPFLIRSDVFENENGESTSEIQLHLDILDAKWTSQYESFDYVIISGGQWFLKTVVYWENGAVVGCHYCQNKNLVEPGFEHLYHKALQKVFSFVTSAKHKPVIFFRTWSPDHFENGEWFNGGSCTRVAPFKKGEYREGYNECVMRAIELEEFNNAASALRGSVDVKKLKLMDTYNLSFLQPDGHVGPYRTPYPFAKDSKDAASVQNDCLHWCVPGPIDAWNDLVMKMVLDR